MRESMNETFNIDSDEKQVGTDDINQSSSEQLEPMQVEVKQIS